MQGGRARGAAPGPSKRSRAMHVHRRRDPREVPRACDPRAQPADPRNSGVPALSAREADAGARLRPSAGRHLHAQARSPPAPEIEEGVAFYGRAGNALMKCFKRLGIDPLVVYGSLCVKCPIGRAGPRRRRSACARLIEEIAIVQPKIMVVMGEPACASSTASRSPSRARSSSARARSRPSPRRSMPSTSPTSTTRWTKRAPSSASGAHSGCSVSGTRTCLRTDQGAAD